MSGEAIRRPVRYAWRRLLEQRAHDDTAASARRSALVVVPHPDDETFGAGATIARKRAAGTRVDVVVVTDGRLSHRSSRVTADELAEMRASEARAACRALGVPDGHLHLLGVPEGTLRERRGAVTAALADLVRVDRPDEILTTSQRDWHDDHREVADIVRTLGPPVLEFPIWWWADGPWRRHAPGRSLPTRLAHVALEPIGAALVGPVERVATGGFLAEKRAAIAAYASQTTNLTGEADWAVLDESWTAGFLGGWECFFPVPAPA